MVINSEPYEFAAEAQLKVTPKQVTFLDHDSHIDTSKLVKLTKMETENVVELKPSAHKGSLSLAVKKLIKELIVAHGIMPKDQAEILMKNL